MLTQADESGAELLAYATREIDNDDIGFEDASMRQSAKAKEESFMKIKTISDKALKFSSNFLNNIITPKNDEKAT